MMQTRALAILVAIAGISAIAAPAQAEDLEAYVETCMAELGFEASELPDLDCNDGAKFDVGIEWGFTNENGPDTHDFVLSRRVNDEVDVTAACRWLVDSNGERFFPPDVDTAVSGVELLIHNRLTGGTCFFSALYSSSEPLRLPRFPGHPARRVSSGNVHGSQDDKEAEEAHGRIQA